MSLALHVGLMSGRAVTLAAGPYENVQDVKQRAQTALGVGKGRLLDSSGGVLDGCTSIKKARLQNRDRLMLHMQRVEVCGSYGALLQF